MGPRAGAGGGTGRSGGAFTLVELLVVISIIGLLAGMLVGLAPAAMAKMRDARVRVELNQLVAAIEEYKSKYGFYPPDGITTVNGRTVSNPALNPLFYELTGMLVINPFNEATGTFRSMAGDEEVRPDVLRKFFGRDGIANASPDKRKVLVQNFKESQYKELYPNQLKAGRPDVEVLVVPVPWPLKFKDSTNPAERPPFPDNPTLNPWRYVSTNPTNNPSSFDLWAEYWQGNNKIVIGNWKR